MWETHRPNDVSRRLRPLPQWTTLLQLGCDIAQLGPHGFQRIALLRHDHVGRPINRS